MELKDIKKLIEWVSSHELTELEIEEESFRVSMKRGGTVVTLPAAAPGTAPVSTALPATASAENAQTLPEDSTAKILSPIVGTFYTASSPESPPFISVGQTVNEDTVVCIIEAMKVMNEIKAEAQGVIREILVENGSPVEYGQALFSLDPR